MDLRTFVGLGAERARKVTNNVVYGGVARRSPATCLSDRTYFAMHRGSAHRRAPQSEPFDQILKLIRESAAAAIRIRRANQVLPAVAKARCPDYLSAN